MCVIWAGRAGRGGRVRKGPVPRTGIEKRVVNQYDSDNEHRDDPRFADASVRVDEHIVPSIASTER